MMWCRFFGESVFYTEDTKYGNLHKKIRQIQKAYLNTPLPYIMQIREKNKNEIAIIKYSIRIEK